MRFIDKCTIQIIYTTWRYDWRETPLSHIPPPFPATATWPFIKPPLFAPLNIAQGKSAGEFLSAFAAHKNFILQLLRLYQNALALARAFDDWLQKLLLYQPVRIVGAVVGNAQAVAFNLRDGFIAPEIFDFGF